MIELGSSPVQQTQWNISTRLESYHALGSLSITMRQLDDAPSNQRIFFYKTTTMSEEHSQVRNHVQNTTTKEEASSRFLSSRKAACYDVESLSGSRQHIVSASKTVCKLLKQASNVYHTNQIAKSFFMYTYIDRVMKLSALSIYKLPVFVLTRLGSMTRQ